MKTKCKFLFLLLLAGFASCSKNDDDNNNNNNNNNGNNNNNNPPTLTVNSNPQFYGVLDGTALSYGYPTYVGMTGASKQVGDSTTAIYGSSLLNAQDVDYASVNFGTVVFNASNPPENANFDAFFAAGNRPFSTGAVNGVELIVRDGNGTEWNSNGNQTGSTFTIDAIQPVDIGGSHLVKLKTSFNCKMYNGSNVKNLSNGVFVCHIEFL